MAKSWLKLSVLLYLLSSFVCACSVFVRAQEPSEQASDATNTKDGLRLFLQAILSATQEHDNQKILTLVKQTEIPNAREWFYSMYPVDKAESWIVPYEKDLAVNEESFRQRFIKFAQTKGQIFVRKVNDEPQPGRGLEWGLLNSANKPLDYYFASWKSSPNDVYGEPIGYFVFIDGMFRWDSLITFPQIAKSETIPVEISTEKEQPLSGAPYKVGGGVSPPKVISSSPPEYSVKAKKTHLQGTVLLSMVIDIDGNPKEIKVIRPLGNELDDLAIKAVHTWRFTPGQKDGHSVPVYLNVQVSFNM